MAVLDLKMEDMDGIEVLKIFKKMLPSMAVIMLTGHGSERAARAGSSEGAFDYLTKPCEFEELLAKIERGGGRGHERMTSVQGPARRRRGRIPGDRGQAAETAQAERQAVHSGEEALDAISRATPSTSSCST